MKSKQEYLASYPVVIEFPIAWGDMDAFQHVNNIMYFRYFENVRLAYFEQKNIVLFMREQGIGPILGETQCRFRAPLTYPDQIAVGTKITDISKDRFSMKYAIYSSKLNKIAATGSGVIVYYDYKQGKKSDIPEEIMKMIKE